MTVGERIKRIRTFRHMTMDEFGAALGFEGKSMSVRVAQYESGTRVPKMDMIYKMAEILNCNYKALDNYNLGAAEDILETLFWLEEASPINLFDLQPMPKSMKSKTSSKAENIASNIAYTDINEDDWNSYASPVAVTFDYGVLNEFLMEWYKKKNEFKTGQITQEEYFEWKITWPHAKS